MELNKTFVKDIGRIIVGKPGSMGWVGGLVDLGYEIMNSGKTESGGKQTKKTSNNKKNQKTCGNCDKAVEIKFITNGNLWCSKYGVEVSPDDMKGCK